MGSERIVKGSTFTCAKCAGIFEATRSDEEALAESHQIFGEMAREDLAIVCESCWRELFS